MSDELVVDSVNLSQPEVVEVPQVIIQIGAELLAARKAKSLTQQDVSNTLRLSIKQIEALESNDFSALPDAMITRGFIRNYARLLGLDAEPLLASYKAQMPDSQPNALSVKSSMHQVVSVKKRQPWVLYSLLSASLLGLLAWFLLMNYQPNFTRPATEKAHVVTAVPAPVVPVTTPLPELALPAAERQIEADAVAVMPDAVTQDGVVSEVKVNASASVVVDANSGSSTNAVSSTNVVNSKSVQITPTAVDFNTLKANAARTAEQAASVPMVQTQAAKAPVVVNNPVSAKANSIPNSTTISTVNSVKTNVVATLTKKVSMSATERSWVSFTDKSGKVVFEKMLTAGGEETFEAVTPMNVVIGNAKATKLVLSGKPVDLVVKTNANVAHLVLE